MLFDENSFIFSIFNEQKYVLSKVNIRVIFK